MKVTSYMNILLSYQQITKMLYNCKVVPVPKHCAIKANWVSRSKAPHIISERHGSGLMHIPATLFPAEADPVQTA
jgi:hypothetical protein